MGQTLELALSPHPRWKLHVRMGLDEFEYITADKAEILAQLEAVATEPDVRNIEFRPYLGGGASGQWCRVPAAVSR